MNTLEDVPFQTLLGRLEEDLQLVKAPDVTVPDCCRILQETEYEFSLEKWILTGQQPVCQVPSCPPYWLMFHSPQETRRTGHRSSDLWVPVCRPRSHSLNSVDGVWLQHHRVKFLISDSDDEDWRCENEGCSLTEHKVHINNRDHRPCSAAPKNPLSRVKDLHCGTPQHCKQGTLQSLEGSLPSLQNSRRLTAAEQHRPQQNNPPRNRQNSKKMQRSLGSLGRKFSQNPQTTGSSPSRLQQQRPSSAGPVIRNCRQKALWTAGSHGVVFDSAAELLSTLSHDERELLETITNKGYSLCTAIVALQKTGYRNPDKVLNYLVATDHLCKLGYDEAQVEEALEMFQNCESKAAEFLHLLTQFNEMGFQQNAIKEVLLVHGNHRERALEELMTRMT
ncbi:ubiquitin-associated protein 1-like isoform X2 [Thalassophryne amazonica]|uniref:ubiquitin-associated protein 1-like isoform X2 n=1 Tax=Thalassophryne amazonica TaxID=390379 RepID=UPI001471CA11|nr:ubiquitin-associated protein 1-like isoform X2 [Thalassophryne amazonica]